MLGGITATAVTLEAEMRFPWSGGLHPWLDVAIETQSDLLGIKSKRYEPFRDRKKVSFSPAYFQPVWGKAMRGFEHMRDNLASGHMTFSTLDAAQLVKHAFGIRTQASGAGRRPCSSIYTRSPGPIRMARQFRPRWWRSTGTR